MARGIEHALAAAVALATPAAAPAVPSDGRAEIVTAGTRSALGAVDAGISEGLEANNESGEKIKALCARLETQLKGLYGLQSMSVVPAVHPNGKNTLINIHVRLKGADIPTDFSIDAFIAVEDNNGILTMHVVKDQTNVGGTYEYGDGTTEPLAPQENAVLKDVMESNLQKFIDTEKVDVLCPGLEAKLKALPGMQSVSIEPVSNPDGINTLLNIHLHLKGIGVQSDLYIDAFVAAENKGGVISAQLRNEETNVQGAHHNTDGTETPLSPEEQDEIKRTMNLKLIELLQASN